MQYRNSHSVNKDIQNINTMDNLIVKPIHYSSKIRRKLRKIVFQLTSTMRGHITLKISQLLKL